MNSPVFDESVVKNPRGYLFNMHTLWEGVDIDVEGKKWKKERKPVPLL